MKNSNRLLKNKKFKKFLAISLAISTAFVSTNNISFVEAKKNHKPKIIMKGKLRSKKIIIIKEGQKVLVKAKVKDKEDGNISKKAKIKVKKPYDGQIEKTGKYIRFLNEGTYKITVSVKDSKRKKATLKRTVVVEPNEDLQTTVSPVVTSRPLVTVRPTVKPTVRPTSTASTKPTASATAKPNQTVNPKSSVTPENTHFETSSPNVSNSPVVVNTSTPKDTINPVITDEPIITTQTPIVENTIAPTESFLPIYTESPVLVPTQEPIVTETPIKTETPILTQTPTLTPYIIPTITPTIAPTQTPVATESVFNDDVVKFNCEELKLGNVTYNVTKEKITNSNFMNDAVKDKRPTIKVEYDYGRLTFDKNSNYFENDGYLKYLGKITAKDYNGNDISSNIVISTTEKFASNGSLRTDAEDENISIYIYVEDKEGNSNTLKFYIVFENYSKRTKQEIEMMPEDYPYLLTTTPYIIFGEARDLFQSLNKSAAKTLKKTN